MLAGTVTEKSEPVENSLEVKDESEKLNVAPESAGLTDDTERLKLLKNLSNPPTVNFCQVACNWLCAYNI